MVLALGIEEERASDLSAVIIEVLADEFFLVKHELNAKPDPMGDAWRDLLLAHLSNIDRILQCLADKRTQDIEAINGFANSYREQVKQRYRLITPPNVSGVRRVPIQTIYVSPRLVQVSRQFSERPLLDEAEYIQETYPALDDVTRGLHRTVVLGSPGIGKTTLIAKVCYELAGRSRSFNVGGRHPVPMPIVLRDFSAVRKVRDVSILDYLVSYASTHLQLDVPPGAIEYLLLTGGAMVLFDGLDELLETSFRRVIVDDVESFCSRYSAAPVLVTSRKVGYEEAPLDDAVFNLWSLIGFSYSEVKTYARKWFSITSDNSSATDLDRLIQTFMDESGHIEDLRSNPLMLALLCNIYRGQHYLPRNRPEVYDRCAIMLFERWDRSRGISVPMSFEPNMSGTLMALAYWIYTDEELQQGVTEKRLVSKVTDYLYKRRFRRIEDAVVAAMEFVQYCRGRAWVLTDTGGCGSVEGMTIRLLGDVPGGHAASSWACW